MEKKCSKRILAFMLTLAMVVTMVPALSLPMAEPAYAAPEATPITQANVTTAGIGNGGQFILNGDVEISEAIVINADVTLDLNGHILASTHNGASMFTIGARKTFTIVDSTESPYNWEIDENGYYSGVTAAAIEGCGHTTGGALFSKGMLTSGIILNKGTFVMNGGNLVGNHCTTANAEYCALYNDLSAEAKLMKGAIKGNLSGNYGTVFNRPTATVTVFEDFELSDNVSKQDGGAICNRGNLYLDGATIKNNRAGSQGGGIHNEGTLVATNAAIINNTANAQGGGFYNDPESTAKATLTNCTISGNKANKSGGGVYVDTNGYVTITNCDVSNNEAACAGGGVYIGYSSYTTYNGGNVSNNAVTSTEKDSACNTPIGGAGGGLYIGSYSLTTFAGVTITGNTTTLYGGGIATQGNSLSNLIINGNSATCGGGIYDISDEMKLSDAQFTANSATSGGSIYIDKCYNTILKNINVTESNASEGAVLYFSAFKGTGSYPLSSLDLSLENCKLETSSESTCAAFYLKNGDGEIRFKGNTYAKSANGTGIYFASGATITLDSALASAFASSVKMETGTGRFGVAGSYTITSADQGKFTSKNTDYAVLLQDNGLWLGVPTGPKTLITDPSLEGAGTLEEGKTTEQQTLKWSAPTGAHFTGNDAAGTTWYTESTCTTEAATFVKGTTYYKKVTLKPIAGYEFASDIPNVPVTNGTFVSVTPNALNTSNLDVVISAVATGPIVPIIRVEGENVSLEKPYYHNGANGAVGTVDENASGANVSLVDDGAGGYIVTLNNLKDYPPKSIQGDLHNCGIEILTEAAFKFVINGENYLGTPVAANSLADYYSYSIGVGIGPDLSDGSPITIGNLTFEGTGNLTIYDSDQGIYTNGGDISFTGFTGKLTIYDCGLTGRKCCLNSQSGNITFDGGTYNLVNQNTNCIQAQEGTVTVNGGTINATAENGGDIYGNNVKIQGGTVNLFSENAYAVCAKSNFEITGAAILNARAYTPIIIGEKGTLYSGEMNLTSTYKNFSNGILINNNGGTEDFAIEWNSTSLKVNHVKDALVEADFLLAYKNSTSYSAIKKIGGLTCPNGVKGYSIYYSENVNNSGNPTFRNSIASNKLPIEAVVYDGSEPDKNNFSSANGFIVKKGDGTTVVNEKTLLHTDSLYLVTEPLIITGTVTVNKVSAGGIDVALKRGVESVDNTTTDADGNFSFANVVAGQYQIIASTTAGIATKICTIENRPVNVGNINITPTKDSVVSVGAIDEGNPDYTKIVVGGVNTIAENTPLDGGNLKITFDVTQEEFNSSDQSSWTSTQSAIVAKTAETLGTDNFRSNQIDFLDMGLYKQINLGAKTNIGDSNSTVLEIIVPYSLASSRNNVTVLRKHGNNPVEVFERLSTRPETGFVDGTFYKGDGFLVIYASKFSDYAIAYSSAPEDGGTITPPGGNNGGGGHTPEVKPVENKPARPSETGADRYLITDEHIVYISGRDTGLVVPQENMTRAEAAQMFYNLLKDKNVAKTVSFADVKDSSWYATAVNALASLNIINGKATDENGNMLFMPNETITRAEFTAMAMRFAFETTGKVEFKDVTDQFWACKLIESAASYGWINGYSDGTFLPNGKITRAEVVTIVNHILGRAADQSYVNANFAQLKQFPDLKDKSKWYFYDMVEATNAHDFDMDENYNETWK